MRGYIEYDVPRYDPLNGSIVTPISSGCDKNCYICNVEEMNEYTDDYEYVGTQLFTKGELLKFKEG